MDFISGQRVFPSHCNFKDNVMFILNVQSNTTSVDDIDRQDTFLPCILHMYFDRTLSTLGIESIRARAPQQQSQPNKAHPNIRNIEIVHDVICNGGRMRTVFSALHFTTGSQHETTRCCANYCATFTDNARGTLSSEQWYLPQKGGETDKQ